jgi:hypothetical protein
MKKMTTLALGLSLFTGSAMFAAVHPAAAKERPRKDIREDKKRQDDRRDRRDPHRDDHRDRRDGKR